MMNRDKLIELLEEGLIDPYQTAFNLIIWISDDECYDYMKMYELLNEDEGE